MSTQRQNRKTRQKASLKPLNVTIQLWNKEFRTITYKKYQEEYLQEENIEENGND